MSEQSPKIVYLKDYRPPDFLIDRVDLRFDLNGSATTVSSRLVVVRNPAAGPARSQPLVLDGRQLELVEIRLDGAPVAPDAFEVDAEHLTLEGVPDAFELEIDTRIYPQNNSSLEGLYTSGGGFCTQCEAEGFRKITYFLDRPDVMAVYSVTIVAERSQYPVLLANGNLVDSGEHGDGRHWVTWHDPFKKPSYLFAMVAGSLDCVTDTYTTLSGRRVGLHFYVEPGNTGKCDHAMRSLKLAMAWDEAEYGFEYDLDNYFVVAVDDFNMGAMENKGLNIFNAKYVLAKPETATDQDLQNVESVIGHEYFHNWTGNRITCRDWFQLSLKEGLTVFREQQFAAAMGAGGVKRIADVRVLRSSQFSQDAGPMAHPVRPDSYIQINNFYTVTVYNKGAEVIRMMHTLLGPEGFRRGMDLYVARHDGCAVTTDELVAAMEHANGADFEQFRRWYHQAGTPELEVQACHDRDLNSYSLRVRQSCPATPGQPRKLPFHVPLAIGLLNAEGRELPLQLEGEDNPGDATTRILEIRDSEHTFRFINVSEPPTLSLLRGFSAPVKVHFDYSDADLMFLLANDSDEFNRWDAGQRLATRTIMRLVEKRDRGSDWDLPDSFALAFGKALVDTESNHALTAELFNFPDEAYLASQMAVADVDGIHEAREYVRCRLAEVLRSDLLIVYQAMGRDDEPGIDTARIGRRSLRNRCLEYLMQLDDPGMRKLCLEQYHGATDMTSSLGAISAILDRDCPERDHVLRDFYLRWRHEPLVVDKWFSLQAMSTLPQTLLRVKALLDHEAFRIRNPNRVRALISAFCHSNPVRFHAVDGEGYRFLSDQVLALDPINSQVAARLVGALSRWRHYDSQRQHLMRMQLTRILGAAALSPDVYEVVAKSLGEEANHTRPS